MDKPRVTVWHPSYGRWFVCSTLTLTPLAGPYRNGGSARYVAKLLNEILEREPLRLDRA